MDINHTGCGSVLGSARKDLVLKESCQYSRMCLSKQVFEGWLQRPGKNLGFARTERTLRSFKCHQVMKPQKVKSRNSNSNWLAQSLTARQRQDWIEKSDLTSKARVFPVAWNWENSSVGPCDSLCFVVTPVNFVNHQPKEDKGSSC